MVGQVRRFTGSGLLLLAVLAGACEEPVVQHSVQPTTAVQEGSRLVGSDSAAGSGFGAAVDIDGDTVVIGAPWGVSTEAYVFLREGSEWVEQAMLEPPDPTVAGRFAYSVAVSGDTVLVGDPLDDEAGDDAGAAFVFVRDGGEWSLQAKLLSDSPQDDDTMGTSVALLGDEALIGAPGGPFSAAFGAVYHYRRTGESWGVVDTLEAPDGEASDYFGTTVAMDEATAVFGAPERGNFGGAYVATRDGDGWRNVRALDSGPDDPDLSRAIERMGDSVAVSGDHIVVGGPGRMVDDLWRVGVAHVYTDNGAGVWAREEIATGIVVEEAMASWSVAADHGLIAIAVREAPGPVVYAYVEGDSGWTHDGTVSANSGDASLFGVVALDDGRMVVGARGEEGNTGAAYIYSMEGAPGADGDAGCGCRSAGGVDGWPLLLLALCFILRLRR